MSDFQRFPFVEIKSRHEVYVGWNDILSRIKSASAESAHHPLIIVVELYPGVFEDEVVAHLSEGLKPALLVRSRSLYLDQGVIEKLVYPDVTDDRLFGRMTRLEIEDYFDSEKLSAAREKILSVRNGIVLIVGTGASIVPPGHDIHIYADMARWEIQNRMRNHETGNLGVENKDVDDWMLLYKQGYFVDWRVCDRLKKRFVGKPEGSIAIDYFLDTNDRDVPKMVSGEAIREGLELCLTRPFSVVPFFDPGPWGGQWMKKVCGLDESVENYAWCFNCVPEENSLLLKISGTILEIPSIDLVFFAPRRLLGEDVYARFGAEFPIRFDFLDTMDGGNLSLQVHPLTEYIRETFGVDYTQDESYYLMDVKGDASVYLGLKDGVDADAMLSELQAAQEGGPPFDAGKYVQTWPVRKHDHYLIPAGTVHCSGKDCVVLEISATPYIFTFKLWDWNRLGLDGRPRPINIDHGREAIQWDRTTSWTGKNLVNRIERVGEGDGWIEEKTGLHETEFIETRRHWFQKKVAHNTNGGVNVLNLVEGAAILVASPSRAFEPFVVHYAETFIVPASVGEYSITPLEENEGSTCATIKAYVRKR